MGREYIITAIDNKWLSGSSMGYFNLDEPMTTADLACMINRCLDGKYKYVSSTETIEGFIELSPYTFYYHDVLKSVNDSTYIKK